MLLSVKEAIGSRLKALDGPLGHLRDVYFDDRTWQVRWLVAALAAGRSTHHVLIDPRSVRTMSGAAIELALTVATGRHAPPSSSALPVCLQYAALGSGGRSASGRDPHLRSCATLLGGYALVEEGEALGVLKDFCLDARQWTLPFLSMRGEHPGANPSVIHPTEIVRQISNAGARIVVRRESGRLNPATSAAAA